MGQEAVGSGLAPGTKITVTVAPARAGTKVGAIVKLLNEKGEVLLGVAGGGPGEVPQGGAAPAAPAASGPAK